MLDEQAINHEFLVLRQQQKRRQLAVKRLGLVGQRNAVDICRYLVG